MWDDVLGRRLLDTEPEPDDDPLERVLEIVLIIDPEASPLTRLGMAVAPSLERGRYNIASRSCVAVMAVRRGLAATSM